MTFLHKPILSPVLPSLVGSATLVPFYNPKLGVTLDSLVSNLIQSPSAIKYSFNSIYPFCHCGHHPHSEQGGHNSLHLLLLALAPQIHLPRCGAGMPSDPTNLNTLTLWLQTILLLPTADSNIFKSSTSSGPDSSSSLMTPAPRFAGI